MNNSEQVLSKDLQQLIESKFDVLTQQSRRLADGFDELGTLLALYDPAPSPILNALDQRGQDFATYFYAAYSDTSDFERSIRIYRTVKSLVRYILLTDRFYEVGNNRYERMAKGLLQSIKKAHGGYIKYSIDFALKQFWPFWEFEQLVKRRMVKGHAFETKELRHFNLFKSSDAPIIYCRVLDNELNFDPNIATIMHYNQALEDMYDDFEDIEEDLNDVMPNIFVLAATDHMPFSKLTRNPIHARKFIVSNERVLDSILTLVEQYNQLINGIVIPQKYAFLKQLSKDYIDRLLKVLGVLS